MIKYLNDNQGFVMGILTAVYVVATVVLVMITNRQARLAKKVLDLSLKAEKAKHRPYVVFDVVYEEVVAYARLRNSGASPATNVRVSVQPRLCWKDKSEGVGFIEKGVAFLAPNRELSQPFGWTSEFFTQYPDLRFSGSISYEDSEAARYEERFEIDLSYVKGMTYIGEVDIGRELEGVKKALERFHNGGFRPLVRTISEADYREEQNRQREEAARYLEELEKQKSKKS